MNSSYFAKPMERHHWICRKYIKWLYYLMIFHHRKTLASSPTIWSTQNYWRQPKVRSLSMLLGEPNLLAWYYLQFLYDRHWSFFRFLQNHIPLKTRTCAPNGECQLQLTKMFVEDTMITCKSWNYKGQMTRNIIIKVRGESTFVSRLIEVGNTAKVLLR